MACFRVCLMLTALAAGLLLAPAPMVAQDRAQAPAAEQQGRPKLVARALEEIVTGGEVIAPTADEEERFIPIYLFYEERNFTPIWVRDSGPKSKAEDFLKILNSVGEDALVPSDYRVAQIEARMDKSDPRSLAELELYLTRALLDYGRDKHAGRVDPREINSVHFSPDRPGNLGLVDEVERADSVGPVLEKLGPKSPSYLRLKDKLQAYRALAEKGDWPKVSNGETLKPGMRDKRVLEVRDLLKATGDLKSASLEPDPLVYDDELVKAVEHFQMRHGLAVDGVIGGNTLKEMNVPLVARIHTMELNMERRRWLQDDLGEYYVFVNLADQELKVVRGAKTIHTAKVVVGKTYHSTPAFSKEMKYLEFNPFWNVPSSIAVNEYLPKLRQDPGVLPRQNIRVFAGYGASAPEVDPYTVDWQVLGRGNFPYRLRQDPGKGNALGQVKFMFPNQFNVYIHDTPSKSLFSRALRIFSHGCVRVEHPLDLAETILRDQQMGWDRRKVDAVVASGQRTVVRLKKPIPVHITYFTVFVNKDGTVHFRRDVYERDLALIEALRRSRLPAS